MERIRRDQARAFVQDCAWWLLGRRRHQLFSSRNPFLADRGRAVTRDSSHACDGAKSRGAARVPGAVREMNLALRRGQPVFGRIARLALSEIMATREADGQRNRWQGNEDEREIEFLCLPFLCHLIPLPPHSLAHPIPLPVMALPFCLTRLRISVGRSEPTFVFAVALALRSQIGCSTLSFASEEIWNALSFAATSSPRAVRFPMLAVRQHA